ncbi:hypothetical protein EVAR_41601_1 [Eumeta japonica]|uniref:Uncharacterized protein n=1 Tax=Eumeta variegata TaxID=151549 RepID=A0A4C1ZY85_EUMVA|nr:hypothetical protein EVAR_41601_1 [Eumeta japonica]
MWANKQTSYLSGPFAIPPTVFPLSKLKRKFTSANMLPTLINTGGAAGSYQEQTEKNSPCLIWPFQPPRVTPLCLSNCGTALTALRAGPFLCYSRAQLRGITAASTSIFKEHDVSFGRIDNF